MTRYIFILIIGLVTQNMGVAQSVLKETFNHSKDQVLDIDLEHTDITFETWDKDVIEIEAFIEGENLTEEDRKAIFEHWDLEVVGNSKKISVKNYFPKSEEKTKTKTITITITITKTITKTKT